VVAVSRILEDMRNEAARKAAERVSVAVALNLLDEGSLSVEVIAKCTLLPIERVRELANERTTS